MAMAMALAGAGIGYLANQGIKFGMNEASNSLAYHRQLSLMNYQNQLNKDYSKWSLLNSPGFQRQGLVNAGYNAMLPFMGSGSSMNYSNASASIPGSNGGFSSNEDLNSALSNAYQTYNLNKKSVDSTIAVNNATTEKISEEAQTERIRRTGMEIDNLIKQNEKIISDSNAKWIEKKNAAEWNKLLAEARNLNVVSDFIPYNAVSGRIGAYASGLNAKSSYISATQGSPFKVISDKIISPLTNSYTYKRATEFFKKVDAYGEAIDRFLNHK